MNRSTAFKLFEEMRYSTSEEQQAYRKMLKKHSTTIEGINIFEMDKKPYNIDYIVDIGFIHVPNWLQNAINKGKIKCNYPETVQDIWDLSYDDDGVPTLTVVKTGKEFRMGGAPITYKDVYGE